MQLEEVVIYQYFADEEELNQFGCFIPHSWKKFEVVVGLSYLAEAVAVASLTLVVVVAAAVVVKM